MPTFTAPSVEELKTLSDRYGLACSQEELEAYHEVLKGSAEGYQRVQELPEPTLPVKYARTPGYRPPQNENQLNAWYWKCSVQGAAEGKLKGKKVVLKDNVMLAGVPMMIGSRTLEGHVPDQDATIVSRILDSGAEIVGKSTTEDLCLSGGSFYTTYQPVLNPLDTTRSAGGSSSGSGALVANGEVDMAIGGDQGGSIRIPASACGIVGLKPTFGLVPYTGIGPIEVTVDHTGPMAKTVQDCALLLEVIAGFDENRDFRQPSCGFTCPVYSEEVKKGGEGMRLAVLTEGYGMAKQEVNDTVKKAIETIKASGKFSVIDEVSVPLHTDGHHIWGPIGLQGLVDSLVDGSGYGTGQSGHLISKFSEKLRQGLKTNANALSDTCKFITMFGSYVKEKYGQAIYAKAQNLALELRRQYDKVLQSYDAILLPTLPEVACKLPDKNTPIPDKIGRALGPIANTAPFDLTHHPALTLNCGFGAESNMPVGLMIVGKRWDDATVLRVGATVESVLGPMQRK